jgi:rubredoxin
MPQVKAYSDIPNPRVQRELPNGHFGWNSRFFAVPEDPDKDSHVAFLAQGSPKRVLRSHFHKVDQFQVMYTGKGKMGAHPVDFGGVHFSRAYTPYGPISYDEKEGLGFITLRAHRDPGAQFMPDKRAELDAVRDRKPWQLTVMPDFNLKPGENGVAMKAIDGLKDDRGLAGFSMVMKPGATAYSIDPSKGDGQYIVVMKGGIMHEGVHKQALAIVWVAKDEKAFHIEAGPEGAEILILNFPVPGGGIPQNALPVSADGKGEFKTYQCILCAFVYDEAQGYEHAGIAPGTRWADVPDTFNCPDCEAKKADFEMIEF